MDRLEAVLKDLSARFDATIERQENEAASDLALSLRQDIDLRDELVDGEPVAVLTEGLSRPVVRVGRDHAIADPGDILVPLSNAVFLRPISGASPVPSDATMQEVLNDRVRAGARVTCSTGELEIEGELAAMGRDYLVVGKGFGRRLVPLGSVRWIRFARGGSAGAP